MRFGLRYQGLQVQTSRLNRAVNICDCRNYLSNMCLQGSNPSPLLPQLIWFESGLGSFWSQLEPQSRTWFESGCPECCGGIGLMLGSCTILIRCWKKSCRPRCQTAWCTRVVTLTKEIEQFASTYQSIRLGLKRRRVVGSKRASYRGREWSQC